MNSNAFTNRSASGRMRDKLLSNFWCNNAACSLYKKKGERIRKKVNKTVKFLGKLLNQLNLPQKKN